MISLVEASSRRQRRPAWSPQVEEIFSPNGRCSPNRATSNTARNSSKWPWRWRGRWRTEEHLIVEAGTGVGKSLAYLIPSILFAVARRKKAVISTHTINLQEQLIEKDLPMLAQVLPVKFNFTMLKGRQNYLCTRRLDKVRQQARAAFHLARTCRSWQRIRRMVPKNRGRQPVGFRDRAGPPMSGSRSAPSAACAAPKQCGHQFGLCQGRRAAVFFPAGAQPDAGGRRAGAQPHACFSCFLGGVEEEAEGGVLFKNDFVVFDEAHTVERVASRHIGLSVSSAQVRYGLQRLWNPTTKKGLLTVLRRGREQSGRGGAEGGGQFFRRGRGGLRPDRRRAGERGPASAAGANCAFAIAIWCRTT